MAGQSGEVVIVPRNFVLLDELDKSEKARRKPPAARPAPRALSGTPATVAGGWGHDVLLRARAARRHLAVRSHPRPPPACICRERRTSLRVHAAAPPRRNHWNGSILGPTGSQVGSSILPARPRSTAPPSASPPSARPSLRLSLAADAPPDAAPRACQVEGRILQLLIFCGKEYPKAAPQARRRPSAGLERLLLLLLLPRTVEGRAPHAPRAARRR